ncbi:MAG: oligosaccharide flippase family protein [Planctomycetes bacterium]|nr:oligosaccharide flippase family protein [Planctomycetota bacterium]
MKSKSTNIFLVGLSSIYSRGSGLLTQIVVAWYLAPHDYGLYAIALGIMTFTTIMRGGGTGTMFQTMTPSEFGTIGGGLFNITLTCGVLGTVLTLSSVLPAQYLYPPDSTGGLGWILFACALQFLTFNISTYPRAIMASKLFFKQIALMDTVAATLKFLTAFYCASHGYGGMSFVVALIVNNLVVILWSLLQCGVQRSYFVAAPNWLPDTIAAIRIPFCIAIITSLGSQLDLFIASFFIPVASLGIYFFANQMAIQPIQLLSSTLQSVLAPYAARIRGDADSENENVRQTFMTGIVFVPIFVMSVAAVYPSMVHLMFKERWDASIQPVVFASVLLIYPTVQTLLEAPIMGTRRWRLTLKLFFGRALGKCVGALVAVGCIYAFTIPVEHVATTLVIGVGVASTAMALFQIQQVSREVHLPSTTFRYEIYSTPLYAILAAVATSGLAKSVVELLEISSTSIRVEAFIEFAFCLLTYTAVSFVLLRFGYIDALHHLLLLFPRNVRTLLYRILVLEEKR